MRHLSFIFNFEMTMKKFLKHTILFALFFLIFYIGMVFVWGVVMPPRFRPNLTYPLGAHGFMHTRIQEVKNTNNVDILFLGSSHAYRGFDTRIFEEKGLSSFNLGSSAQSPIESQILLKRYLSKINPKLVVWEVFPATIEGDGVESALDLIANDKIDYLSFGMAWELKNISLYNNLLFGFFREILGMDRDFEEPKSDGTNTYISGGYVERSLEYWHVKPMPAKRLTINPKQLEALEKAIELIKSQGRDIVLVQAPTTATQYGSILNNTMFDSLMSRQGYYKNYNQILALNDSLHFYDSHHLNQAGVEIFDTKFIEDLKTNNWLK